MSDETKATPSNPVESMGLLSALDKKEKVYRLIARNFEAVGNTRSAETSENVRRGYSKCIIDVEKWIADNDSESV